MAQWRRQRPSAPAPGVGVRCKHCGAPTRVLATRKRLDGHVLVRSRRCNGPVTHTYSTFEVDDDLELTISKYALNRARGATLRKRVALHKRNQRILTDLVAGKRHSDVAAEHHLSPNMVSTIAKRAGVPAYRDLKPFLRNG